MSRRTRERLAWVITVALALVLARSLWPEQAHAALVVAAWLAIVAVVVSAVVLVAALIALWVLDARPVDLDEADGVRRVVPPLTPEQHARAKRLRDDEWRNA